MGRRVRLLSALAAGTLAYAVGTSTAHAVLKTDQYKCQVAIGKEGAKFATSVLKLRQKCIAANLSKGPGTCNAPDGDKLQKLRDKLDVGLAKSCSFSGNIPGNLAAIGFPGPCTDVNLNDKFTLTDLQKCIRESHENLIGGQCVGGTNTGQACTIVGDCPDNGSGTSCVSMLGVEYDSTVVAGPLTGTALKCQKEIAKNAAKYVGAVLKNVQKCRNSLLNCTIDQDQKTTCKLDGLLPEDCATSVGQAVVSKCTGGTNDGAACRETSECPGGTCEGIKFGNKTVVEAIAKAKTKAHDAIASKCSNDDVAAIKACEPDQTMGDGAAMCELDAHQAFADNPIATALSDFLDYEYAKHGLCGDNRLNQNIEECDGIADADCPDQCGDPLGNFPCLCLTKPRSRIIEHSNADLDNGWKGPSHDAGIVEGGGYVTDLWDCDGPGGPDKLCNAGPSCNLSPHQPCSPARNQVTNADNLCPGLDNFCRKTTAGATGPHCEIEFKKSCKMDSDCLMLGDHCLIVAHGAPLPLSSGGVAVCIINEFSEDVVGTVDFATGASSVRLRQNSSTYAGGDQQQPCPVCGGFCSGSAGPTGPVNRNLCSTNADCTNPAICITEAVCSWGPDQDKPCNPNTPRGGPTKYFGNPSRDCRMNGDLFGTLDILFNPATTGQTSLTANQKCNTVGFNNKRCAGGTNEFAVCTNASECPGGSCNDQCFCYFDSNDVTHSNKSTQPNACQNACLGGPQDQLPCNDDTDCGAPGFCHPGDCRVNPSDTGSSEEGVCTVGPVDGNCSGQTFWPCEHDSGCSNVQVCIGGSNDNTPCTTESECAPSGTCGLPQCLFCAPNETCEFSNRQCFVGPTIHRTGALTVDPDKKTTAAIFCINNTTSSAVNTVAGLPGPGAITQPTTTVEVGF